MTTILVIEDEAPLLEEVLEWLWFEGYEAVGAANGNEGVQIALQKPPDLIISDVMMPEMDGFQVLEELRKHDSTALIPFLFLTARADRNDVRFGMEQGADDYITKPFSQEDILGAIRVQLHKRNVQQQRADKSLQELRHNLSFSLPHELRTPLVGIIGYGELIEMSAGTLDAATLAQIGADIIKSGERLHHLIENYLTYAKIEITSSEPTRIQEMRAARLESAGGTIAFAAQQAAYMNHRDADLALELDDAPVHISDSDLEKVVSEVVDNAFKFSKPGTPVRITSSPTDLWYSLCVSDQGRGMTLEQIASVGAYMQFDRTFYEQQGCGLGLAIARRLVELYGGILDIQSEVGIGTQVCMTIPMA